VGQQFENGIARLESRGSRAVSPGARRHGCSHGHHHTVLRRPFAQELATSPASASAEPELLRVRATPDAPLRLSASSRRLPSA